MRHMISYPILNLKLKLISQNECEKGDPYHQVNVRRQLILQRQCKKELVIVRLGLRFIFNVRWELIPQR